MKLPEWTDQVAHFAQTYAQHVAVGAGAAGALVAVYAIRRFTKKREHDEVAANLGVLLFLVVTTEGMWEVVHHRLGVNIGLTIAMFAAYDVVIYSQGAAAVKALTKDKNARIGSYLLIIWLMSAAASTTVSFASGNPATWFFRFFSPLVGAALWTQKVMAKRGRDGKAQESNWIYTPTRLMVLWGWMKPGAADDLSEVFRQRRITGLVDAGVELYAERAAERLHAGQTAGRSWWPRRDKLAAATRRVQRLAKTASREDVAAARDQLRLTFSIEDVLLGQGGGEVDDWTRQQLDGVRTETARAVRALRSQGHLARGHGLPPRPRPEPTVEIAGIRMPAHLAAQIGPLPTQPGGSPATHDEARRESATDSPTAATAAQRPERMTVTESVREPAQKTDDKPLRSAHARLTKKLGREPTGEELGQAAGVSKATANRWKRDRISK